MQRLEVSCAVRRLYRSLGVKGVMCLISTYLSGVCPDCCVVSVLAPVLPRPKAVLVVYVKQLSEDVTSCTVHMRCL